jgi:hypothetical protein
MAGKREKPEEIVSKLRQVEVQRGLFLASMLYVANNSPSPLAPFLGQG